MKKLTIEYVKQKTKELAEGYECISNTYINSKTKLEFRCNKNHEFKMIWANFKKGSRCRECWKNNITLYNTYAHQISWCEKVRRDPSDNNLLQVKCTESSCRKWFNPTTTEVTRKIDSINSTNRGSNNFYCSKECKQKCCVFNQRKYPKGSNKYEKYRTEVYYLSNQNFRKHYYQINPENLRRGKDYHLDHIYPVIKGFENNIAPEIIADPSNLQILPAKENIKKRDIYIRMCNNEAFSNG